MKDNTMFSDLELFKDKEFFNKNNLITISKGDKEYIYEVFSVYYMAMLAYFVMRNFTTK